MSYKILHDNGNLLCFVGHSMMSRSTYNIVKEYRDTEICSHEDLDNKDSAWFQQRQFIVISSDVAGKIITIKRLEQHGVHFFSAVNQFNTISPTTIIGHGTYIGGFNSFDVDDIKIGNHVVICSHNTFGHDCCVGDFCHISHYSFFNQSNIGTGTVVGTQVLMCPPKNSSIEIAKYCNITSNSRITSSIIQSGTYHSRRLISPNDSRIERIL